MNFRISLLFVIVALCPATHVVCRGVQQEQKIISAPLEVISPWEDCIGDLETNANASRCDVNLFETENAQLENMKDYRYLMFVEIGSTKQKFKVKIDTGSDVLWVFGEECKDEEPKCVGHRKFKSGESDTFSKVDKEFKLKYVKGEVSGIMAQDDVFITKDLVAKEQEFGSAKVVNKKYSFDGILGINLMKTFGVVGPVLKAMETAKMDPIFSLYLKGGGSSENGGEITFGGNNEARIKKDSAVKAAILAGGKFLIQMDEVKFGDSQICTKAGEAYCKALMDSGASLITGPQKEIAAFNNDILKAAQDGTVVCKDIATFPDMDIKLGDKQLKLKSADYILIKKRKDQEDRCVSLLLGMENPRGTWTFGVPFLRGYYTEYNMKKDEESVTFYKLK